MIGRLREERGMAMVVAILVVFVVLILSTIVVQQSIHNVDQSGRDRDRLLAVDAAEAGLNNFYNYLQTTPLDEIAAAPYTEASGPMVVELDTAPTTAGFTATAVYYDEAGVPMDPATFTNANHPSSVYVRSVGTVDDGVPRTMETWVNLTPVYGGFGAAIITMNGLNLVNNLTLNGYTTNDADIYVNSGNLVVNNQPDIFGSVYVVAGTASLSGNSNIRQNLWANGSVTINNPSMVTGSVTSSTSSITVSGSVGGNATAGTTITGSANVAGTSTPNTIQGPPPSQPLPQIRWVESDWTDADITAPDQPYVVVPFTDCTLARNYILTNPTPPAGFSGVVVRIDSTCALNFANNTSVTLNGNLAIVTDGSIAFTNKNTWTGAGATRKLFLISAYRDGLNCASGTYDITTSNNTDFLNADVFFYSPCTINLNNQNKTFNGQVLGGTVNINNQFTLNYVPVKVPGAGEITGFDQDIAYIREVVST